MNLDYSPENQPKGTYRKAMNALSPLDAQGEISNEKGKQLTDTLPGDILGDISIPSQDMSVLFLSNNEIVKFSKGKYSSIYYDKDLNFSTKVYGDFVIKNNGDIVIIFWDGKNEVRNLNITDASKCVKEKLSLFNKLSHCPLIKNINISTSGGIAVNTGAYQFWIRYKTEDGELYAVSLSANTVYQMQANGSLGYTFTGNGNWEIASNWSYNNIPPSVLPAGAEIIIDPAINGECVLNSIQTISAGAKFSVRQNKKFIITGDLLLQ